jgi:SMODS domain-containing protein
MGPTATASFNTLLRDLNLSDRQVALAEGRIAHLQSHFSAPAFQVRMPPRAIGSYGCGTLVAWERDIDVIVALADAPYWERYKNDSRTFLYWIRDGLNTAYPGTKVSSKEVAVRMFLAENLQVDLVPAFGRDTQGAGFYIPNGSRGWLETNPLFHQELVAKSDARLGGRLKPLIRVMKAWNLANGHHLKSFHVQMMVERMWKEASSMPASVPVAMASSLKAAASWLANPFPDPWFPTQKIDSYLSAADRAKVIGYFETDAADGAKANAAEAAGRHAEANNLWDSIFRRASSAFH